MTAVQPGDRIVAFYDTAICDGISQHQLQIWTDGIVAYADLIGTDRQATLISRDTTVLTVVCPGADEKRGCTGHAVFDLSDECWTTDRPTVQMLDRWGERIES